MKYNLPKELILAYDDLFAGNGINFPVSLFSKYSRANCNKYCLELYRYAFETHLNWTPEAVRDKLTMDVLNSLRLSTLLPYITFPGGLDPEICLFYIAWAIYPQTRNKEIDDVELELYQAFLDNKIERLPKGYFTDEDALRRAYNCLIYCFNKYRLYNNDGFKFADRFDEYEFFSSMCCVKFLRDSNLIKVYNTLEMIPLEYFHYALNAKQKSDLFFNYFLFRCQCEQKSKKKKGK